MPRIAPIGTGGLLLAGVLAAAASESAAQGDRSREARDAERRRIVSSTDATAPVAARALLDQARTWRAESGRPAALALEKVMAATWESAPALAEDALVEWVDLRSRDRALDAADLDALPSGWTGAAVEELRRYLSGDWAGTPPAVPSWTRDDARLETIAQASLAAGRGWLLKHDFRRANACWSLPLRWLPLGSTSGLDLRAELASLYLKSPALDPSGTRLDALVEDLYGSKRLSYSTENDRAIQRHHMILGAVLFQRGRLRRDLGIRSALFQLERAIEKAAERDARSGAHQPLVEERRLFAETLEKVGDRTAAGRAFLRAAEAFLDLDDLAGAAAALVEASRAAGEDAAVARRAAELGELLRRRREPGPPAASADAPDDSAFEMRQRFKLAADEIAARGRRGEDRRAGAARDAARLLGALRARRPSLTGIGDVLRVERLASLLPRQCPGPDFVPRTLSAAGRPPESSGRLLVSLAGELDPFALDLPPETLLAARIAEELSEARTGAGLLVEARRVQVARSTLPEAAEALAATLRERLGGVAVVLVEAARCDAGR